MSVTVRFAPSPTGFLHIGGARTALFNWLFAKHHQGRFRLRIEDTDRARSTPEAIDAILDGLKWLELDWDGEVVHQSNNLARHAEIARQLLAQGKAYRCYCSTQELEAMRLKALQAGKSMRYDGTWRDRDPKDAPRRRQACDPAPRRQQATPPSPIWCRARSRSRTRSSTISSSCVPTAARPIISRWWSDDLDMAITHVIRGDDHLNNAFRQSQIYRALGWAIPRFAHIPLIHGPDGQKMSKRHGALGVQEYRTLGYLPEALRNYLLRLGWSHGDDEIISTAQAIAWFDFGSVGRAAARFDFAKLDSLNGHYIRETPDDRLAGLVAPFIAPPPDPAERALLLKAMPGLKPRAKTLVELASNARFYVAARPIPIDEGARKLLDTAAKARLKDLHSALSVLVEGPQWNAEHLENLIKDYCQVAN